jgi:hypothetical protein
MEYMKGSMHVMGCGELLPHPWEEAVHRHRSPDFSSPSRQKNHALYTLLLLHILP